MVKVKQIYGLKYPFSIDNNDGIFLDTNQTYNEKVRSQLYHLLFTNQGERLRKPEFGTNLLKFIFDPKDSNTITEIKISIRETVSKYLNDVSIDDIVVIENGSDDNSKEYGLQVKILYTVLTTGQKDYIELNNLEVTEE